MSVTYPSRSHTWDFGGRERDVIGGTTAGEGGNERMCRLRGEGQRSVRTFPPASPFMSHRLTVLSSPQLYSSLNAFHPTHATSSLCTLLVDVTLRRMAPCDSGPDLMLTFEDHF